MEAGQPADLCSNGHAWKRARNTHCGHSNHDTCVRSTGDQEVPMLLRMPIVVIYKLASAVVVTAYWLHWFNITEWPVYLVASQFFFSPFFLSRKEVKNRDKTIGTTSHFTIDLYHLTELTSFILRALICTPLRKQSFCVAVNLYHTHCCSYILKSDSKKKKKANYRYPVGKNTPDNFCTLFLQASLQVYIKINNLWEKIS